MYLWKYGLPRTIRSDNGAPFGSAGFMGLSQLSVWLLKHGVCPDKIAPAKPQQNGRLERFHRTLKQDVMFGAKVLYKEYETRTNDFIIQYNDYRPHESLDYRTPSEVYHKSETPYTGIIKEYSYLYGYELIRVCSNGYIRIAGIDIYVSESLKREWVGIGQKTANGTPILFYGYPLGYLEQHLDRKRNKVKA